MNESYDVVVIGSGAAGLSGAVALAGPAAGLIAGAAINTDLVAADAEHAVTIVSMRKSA